VKPLHFASWAKVMTLPDNPVDRLTVNHGMKPGTSLAPRSVPPTGCSAHGLWTGGQAYPHAGDSGDNQFLTARRGESRAVFVVASRAQFGQSAGIPDIHSTTDSIIQIL